MKGTKKRQGIVKAFNVAIEGILYTFKSERNMKIHYCVAVIVLVASMFFKPSRMEMIALIMAISLVVISEMFNTAIEKAIDMVTEEHHPLAKISKDVAAGGVLIATLNSVVVGYLVFYDKISKPAENLINSIRRSELHITLICIVVVLIAVVVVKTLTNTGTPLKGGMPSGHSALAFAMATMITMMTGGLIQSTLSYLMAFLVAQSRIEGKIHTFWETVAGSILGVLVGLAVYQIGWFY
ncbi:MULTISPECIES: diacylglycerol kinase [Romboutsia]|uniref:PAP2 protein n=1 Tax=Romboutsia hominis TaxID=1507512 RepID=A0A2P2BPA9_9FIRM|nr:MULTISPECIES: diacylglycerol kinase [Romboutsia]MCH1959505.1 diacylglycerol kinase [Romboutsia hominis]MCH1970073.1 diacylglycerol kinase [Romboutsia hominis]MDB8791301.1 diacylglycerol kinase [Romboutsia sp. 1001216sp1]MDB8792279.1 diacylglycerol kinase [Romboutsia sp. 1001216sp1]MDB8795574.1 diacylglycerol kinase [Romboutsia sp. 1001216sp1]